MNILIAEDEPDMLKIIALYFEKANFNIFIARDGEEALTLFYKEKIDLAILDWMMPKINGLEVCKEMKQVKKVKVLMLTAKETGEDEYVALSAGADDYINKPFYPKVLLTRAKKLLKIETSEEIGDLFIDFEAKHVLKQNKAIDLTKTEFELLRHLAQNKGQILSRDQLLDLVWGMDYEGEIRTVDTHIRRLREKIGESKIKTHRGMGYSLHED